MNSFEIYKTLERHHTSKYGSVVQNVIFINILINIIAAFSSEVFKISTSVSNIFNIIEYITVLIFVIELITRYAVIGKDKKYQGFKGRVKFTFTPFILIDILSLVPYLLSGIHTEVLLARLIRFLRFFRVLKLIRIKDTVRKFCSVSGFATSPIYVQFIVLFLFSIFFILLFSLVYNGDKTSLLIFLDPSSLAEAQTNTEMTFGVIELIIGLLIGGALISIITELLNNVSSDIKKGYYPFRGSNHIVIINNNDKLEFILEEINYYYKDEEELQDVVLFLPFEDDIESFSQNRRKYSNLKITYISGEALNWNSYKKVNINNANKVMILEDKKTDIKYLNVKITKFITSHCLFNNSSLEFIVESENYKNISSVYDGVFETKKNIYSIINHNNIIQKVLNRSITQPDYFKVFSSLLSYKNYEFTNIKASQVLDCSTLFKDLYLSFNESVLSGIIKDNKILLNPPFNTFVEKNDSLIVLQRTKFDYNIENDKQINKSIINIKKPKQKVSRKVCVIGNYDDINNDQIVEFLDKNSADKVDYIVSKEENYMQDSFWEKIIREDYDIIILNLEDDFELLLTMHLRNKYKDNKRLLKSIINIIHSPTIAKMLLDNISSNNIILSERLVGKYITQVMFDRKIIDIFDELTQSKGSEFYILEKQNYLELFELDYSSFKINLIENNMIYIGSMKNDEFIVDYKNINEVSKVIVLAQGKSNNK